MAYRVDFAESAREQIRALSARQRATLFDAIERQLQHEPMVETRNRKPLRPNPIAPWELRVGNLRIFYEVAAEEPDRVRVLAVGIKEGSIVRIAGDEVKL
jgi:mRNA-degrading endonuclease RelE of RelBE toxin-antitoxin system